MNLFGPFLNASILFLWGLGRCFESLARERCFIAKGPSLVEDTVAKLTGRDLLFLCDAICAQSLPPVLPDSIRSTFRHAIDARNQITNYFHTTTAAKDDLITASHEFFTSTWESLPFAFTKRGNYTLCKAFWLIFKTAFKWFTGVSISFAPRSTVSRALSVKVGTACLYWLRYTESRDRLSLHFPSLWGT